MINTAAFIVLYCHPDIVHLFLAGNQERTHLPLIQNKIGKRIPDGKFLYLCRTQIIVKLVSHTMIGKLQNTGPFQLHFSIPETQKLSACFLLFHLKGLQLSLSKCQICNLFPASGLCVLFRPCKHRFRNPLWRKGNFIGTFKKA